MVSLIACLSTGKGTWTEVFKLINVHKWDKVYLIVNSFVKDNLTLPKNCKLIIINSNSSLEQMVQTIKKEIKIDDLEVALNIISGSGKEHTAILETVLELGLNFRFVTLNDKQEMVSLGLNS